MTLSIQFMTILSMIAGGVYLGAALDTYRRFAHRIRKKKWLIYSAEILFWVGQTVILFYLLFKVNNGELRVYVYIACLLGFSMYQALFKRSFHKVLDLFIRISCAIGRFLRRLFQTVIFRPIAGLVQIAIVCILSIIQLVGTIIGFIGKICLYPLMLLLKGINRLLPQRLRKMLHKVTILCSTIGNRCKKIWTRIYNKRR